MAIEKKIRTNHGREVIVIPKNVVEQTARRWRREDARREEDPPKERWLNHHERARVP